MSWDTRAGMGDPRVRENADCGYVGWEGTW